MINWSKLELVVLDMDGVLVDTTPAHEQAFEDLWAIIGCDGPGYSEIAGRPTRTVVKEVVGGEVSDPLLSAWVGLKQETARRYLAEDGGIVFPDVVTALRELAATGHRLALGTAASPGTTNLVLSRLAAAGAPPFEVVVTSEDVRQGKPHPEVYLEVMERMQGGPTRTLVVEDSRAGVSAGLGSGAFVASVRGSAMSPNHARYIGHFEDLAELVEMLVDLGRS